MNENVKVSCALENPQWPDHQIEFRRREKFWKAIEEPTAITFPAARPKRTIPSFRPDTCDVAELDDGKIFIVERWCVYGQVRDLSNATWRI